MQFTIATVSGLAAALFATGSNAFASAKNADVGMQNRAKVVNNCGYPVYLWSIINEMGCPADQATVLNTGDFYTEEFRAPINKQGVSIKISKTKECKGVDITQLEYFLETENRGFSYNYLDVSYVDCLGGDCPGRKDGYYLQSGKQDRAIAADSSKSICPTFQCTDTASCDKTSYVNWDDVQTKSCGLDEPLDFYLCGLNAQGGNNNGSQPSENKEEEQTEPTKAAVNNVKINAAPKPEITPAPVPEEPKVPNVKTEVVYVTKYEYVNAKRHAHANAHARRHFKA